jgi:hypothetical protein
VGSPVENALATLRSFTADGYHDAWIVIHPDRVEVHIGPRGESGWCAWNDQGAAYADVNDEIVNAVARALAHHGQNAARCEQRRKESRRG